MNFSCFDCSLNFIESLVFVCLRFCLVILFEQSSKVINWSLTSHLVRKLTRRLSISYPIPHSVVYHLKLLATRLPFSFLWHKILTARLETNDHQLSSLVGMSR